MRGYVFISEKKSALGVSEQDIQSILAKYNGLTDMRVRQSNHSTLQCALFTFTNEPEEINYSLGKYDFATSGNFLSPEQQIFEGFIDASDKKKFMSEMGGINTFATFINQKFSAWNNVTRVEPIYWTETNDRIVVGTRAILVHLLAYNTNVPSYNHLKMISFLNNGFYADDSTPFKNLQVVEPNRCIEIIGNKVKVTEIDHFERDLYSLTPTKEDYDELTEAYLNSFMYLKNSKVELSTGLTGGKDSRMIAAAMKYLNISFAAHTNGYESTPDVIVAQKVAEILNVTHEFNEPKMASDQLNVDLFRRTVNAIKNSEGLLYSYENVGNNYTRFNSNKMKFGGQGGEALRGGYARKHQFTEKSQVERFMLNAFIKYKEFFNEQEVREYERFIKDFIYVQSSHLQANDILNYFFLKYRTGRWSSGSRPLYTSLSYAYSPLFENQLVKKAQLFDTKFGADDSLLYNLLQRLAPELIDVPFADDRWNFEVTGPYHKYDLKKWMARQPVQTTSKLSGFNWRKNILNTSKKEFEEVILGYESSPLFDIVNKEKVKKLFMTNIKNPSRYDAFLWSLYTGNILLSNKWYEPITEKSRVSIQIPRRSNQKVVGVTEEFRHIPNACVISKDVDLSLDNLDEVTSIVEWQEFKDTKMYLQIFDGAFTVPPNSKYQVYSNVKGSKAKFRFEIEKIFPTDFEIDLYFIQYDEEKRIKSEMKSFFIQNHKQQYEVEIPLLNQTESFKIAFRLKRTPTEGKFSLNQMFIEFIK